MNLTWVQHHSTASRPMTVRPWRPTWTNYNKVRGKSRWVAPDATDHPFLPNETVSVEFRQDGFRRTSAGKDNLNETLSLNDFDSRDRTIRIDSLDAATRGFNTSGRSQPRRGESSLSNVQSAVTSRLRGQIATRNDFKALRPAVDGGRPSGHYSWCLTG